MGFLFLEVNPAGRGGVKDARQKLMAFSGVGVVKGGNATKNSSSLMDFSWLLSG